QMHYWQHSGLPNDEVRLSRIAGIDASRWNAVRDAIKPLFGTDWHDERLEARRAESEATYLKRSAAGKKGGRPKNVVKLSGTPGSSPAFTKEKPGLSTHTYNHKDSPFQEEEPTRARTREVEGNPALNRYAEAKAR